MTREEWLAQLERRLEVKPGSLRGSEELASFPAWDSLTLTDLSIFVERAHGVRLSVKRLSECVTVQDLINVVDKPLKP